MKKPVSKMRILGKKNKEVPEYRAKKKRVVNPPKKMKMKLDNSFEDDDDGIVDPLGHQIGFSEIIINQNLKGVSRNGG